MRPFRTILFAADFSDNSREAFGVACSLAVENKTRLIVLHVVEPAWVADQPVDLLGETVQYVGRRDETHLDALKQKMHDVYAPNHPIDVAYCVREGDAAAEILHMAQEIGSDLIITGTHGRAGMRWLLAGSVAIAVLRGAHCPVLALRASELPMSTGAIRLILHPTDFSTCSEDALQVARSLARDLGARLVVLHVAPLEVLTEETDEAVELDQRAIRGALEDMRKRLDGPDLKYPVDTRVGQGFAPDVILAMAEDLKCDLIVMGTHGRTGMSRALMGSVAESVLPKAERPVMVVKPFRDDLKTATEGGQSTPRGTVPFCSDDSAKSGQSPTPQNRDSPRPF
jgi:nucleotide-binding universal stress UspA family protein